MGRLPLLSILFAVVGFFSLSLAPHLHSEDISAHQIKAGVIVGASSSNEAKVRLRLKGMEDYFRFINDAANGISGKKLHLVVIDSAVALMEASQASEKLLGKEKTGLSAVWRMDTEESAGPILEEVPLFNVSTCRKIPLSSNPYAYSPFGGVDLSSYAILQFIEMIHNGSAQPKVGILSADDTCGKNIRRIIETYASGHPLQVVAATEFTPGSSNLEPQLLKLKESGAEYIFLQCDAPDALTALKAADSIQFDAPFFSPWKTMDTDSFKPPKGPVHHRINISFPGCLPGDGSSGIHLVKLLTDRYKSVSGFNFDYWEGVAIAAIMARAFQRAHEILGRVDGQTVKLALETFQKEDFGELVPNITYTDTDHGASFVTRIVRINKNRSFTPVTEFWNPKKEKVTIIP